MVEWSSAHEEKHLRITHCPLSLMQIGEKSLFTKELENALERNE